MTQREDRISEEAPGGGAPIAESAGAGVTAEVDDRAEQSPAVEAHDEDEIRAVGASIRRLRQARGLSLRELGERTGLSTGFLSLVERGRSSLALTSLSSVAKALGVDAGHFFPRRGSAPTPHPLPSVTRAGEGSPVSMVASERTYRLLSGRAPDKVLEPMLVTMQPTDTHTQMYTHEGEEFCYVLSGELIYVVDGVDYSLSSGDSIHVRSTVPHAIRNESGFPVEAIWVLTPPLLK